ncbi:MAG: hypothetical protein ACYTGR_12595 [Planctomycetota bacterium]|jgi:hypothetical protein
MLIRINGKLERAHVDRRYADTEIGHPALVLDTGTIVEPSFAIVHDVTLVEATPEERRVLSAAGYELARDAALEQPAEGPSAGKAST